MCHETKQNCSCSSTVVKNTRWSDKEDDLMRRRWPEGIKVVATAVGRTIKSCQDRWKFRVNPILRLKKDDAFSPDEDEAILEARTCTETKPKVGWADMEQNIECLNNRSTVELSNRHGKLLRLKRKSNEQKMGKLKKRKN